MTATAAAKDISPAARPAHEAGEGFVSYVNKSPTPYHAVHEAVQRLEASGFVRLRERESWSGKVKPKGKYYVTRNQTSLIAFALGGNYKPGQGFAIVGTHTDSCCFKVRPISKREDSGYDRVGVETYGGGLWHTWLDRDLGLAGRVIVSPQTQGAAAAKSYQTHLIKIDRPVLRIPTIAIHLDRTQNDSTSYNKETQMVPILALANSALNAKAAATDGAKPAHSPVLLQLVADHLSLQSVSEIENFDLSLFDIQPAVIGGAENDFIFSARIDNLFSTYCAVEAMAATTTEALESDDTGRLIALWDHEEVGSGSAMGAESNFLESVIGRVTTSLKSANSEEEVVHQTIANSFLVSSDMGHAVHPSFPEKHEVNHRPQMNAGPAIKTNAMQRYATSAESVFLLKRIAKKVGCPLQEYEVRNDMPCGSTIGPLVSKIGLRTVDIGCPQLSMHSIRETAGAKDVAHLINLLKGFFNLYSSADAEYHFE